MLATLFTLPFFFLSPALKPDLDIPEPHYPELELTEQVVLPDEENAFLDLYAFLVGCDLDELSALSSEIMGTIEDGSPQEREDLLAQSQNYLELLGRMESKPAYRSVVLSHEDQVALGFLYRHLSYLYELEISVLLDRGENKEAMLRLCAWLRFSNRLQGETVSLVQNMFGLLVLGKALDGCERFLIDVPQEMPTPLIRELLKVPDMRQAAWRVLVGEFLFLQRYHQNLKFSPTLNQVGGQVIFKRWDDWWLELPVPPLLYQTNQTLAYYAESFLRWRPYLQAELLDRTDVPFPKEYLVPETPVNIIGIKVFNWGSSHYPNTAIDRMQKQEAHAHALIWLAFQNVNREAPLHWFPDPYTGKALRVEDGARSIRAAGMDRMFDTEDDVVFEFDSPHAVGP